MSNPIPQTYFNPSTAYYSGKNEPLTNPLISPVKILSADGTKQDNITVDNTTSDFNIVSDGKILLSPGEDQDAVISLNYNLANPSLKITNSSLVGNILALTVDETGKSTVMSNNSDLNLKSSTQINFTNYTDSSTGAIVNIVGTQGNGRVYDSQYNLPYKQIAVTGYSSGTPGNITYINTSFNIPDGLYMLQLSAEDVISAPGTRLRIFVVPGDSAQVINFSNASISADTNMTEFSLSSNFFVTNNLPYKIYIQSSGANWTATEWNLQLVGFN